MFIFFKGDLELNFEFHMKFPIATWMYFFVHRPSTSCDLQACHTRSKSPWFEKTCWSLWRPNWDLENRAPKVHQINHEWNSHTPQWCKCDKASMWEKENGNWRIATPNWFCSSSCSCKNPCSKPGGLFCQSKARESKMKFVNLLNEIVNKIK